MTISADDLKRRLLSTLVQHTAAEDDPIRDLSAQDWAMIDGFAAQHRLRPMLQHLQNQQTLPWSLPAPTAVAWQEAYRRATGRLLRHLAVMVELARRFDTAGIHYAFLKGSTLATGPYPDPAVRALRDLDVLIAPGQTDQAFALLAGPAGFLPRSQISRLAPEDYSTHKHLEPLHCPRRKVTVELHRRLADNPIASAGRDILFDPDRLLAATRTRLVGDTSVRFLDWPETLLHLITHAVHDHQLNNGPLILTDVQVLLTRTPLDLDRFWQLASEAGRVPAAALIFAMVDRLGGLPGLNRQPAQQFVLLSPTVIDAGNLMLLQDTGRSLAVGSWTKLQSGGSIRASATLIRDRWRHLNQTALRADSVYTDQRLSIWQRGRAMFMALLNAKDRNEIRRSKAVNGWLKHPR